MYADKDDLGQVFTRSYRFTRDEEENKLAPRTQFTYTPREVLCRNALDGMLKNETDFLKGRNDVPLRTITSKNWDWEISSPTGCLQDWSQQCRVQLG